MKKEQQTLGCSWSLEGSVSQREGLKFQSAMVSAPRPLTDTDNDNDNNNKDDTRGNAMAAPRPPTADLRLKGITT